MSDQDDPWEALRLLTDARIGLGRAGGALPTQAVLDFAMAHALARDAVRTPVDWAALGDALRPLCHPVLHVASAARDRTEYLRRPDLGRMLDAESRRILDDVASTGPPPDLLVLIGDGLSATAIASQAAATVAALMPWIASAGWRLAPLLLAREARVALGDDAGERLRARSVLVLIGERPGLSSPDSLGAYLTWEPRVGRNDSERNCVSNIRERGLRPDAAAFRIAWLLRAAFTRRVTGVTLKDDSAASLPDGSGDAQSSVQPISAIT